MIKADLEEFGSVAKAAAVTQVWAAVLRRCRAFASHRRLDIAAPAFC